MDSILFGDVNFKAIYFSVEMPFFGAYLLTDLSTLSLK
jgi:hypothetical protein